MHNIERAALGVLSLLWGFVAMGAGQAATSQTSASAVLPPVSPFAGSEACGICHEDISKAFTKSPHHEIDIQKKHGFVGKACESCHGPGQKHTESTAATDIRNPGKLAAAAIDRICLTCHLNQPTQTGRLQSSHARDQVACTTCHKIHIVNPGDGPLAVRKPEAVNALCASCHSNEWAQFQKPFHHRLPEGSMSCVDCHNPHGTAKPAMLQSFGANEPGCLNCHSEKRGPFAFEHGPVRFEGCATCHEPHGSANARMLTRPQVKQVCLECHENLPTVPARGGTIGVVPPAFHDLRSPRYQNCTVCHQKIHGSYADRNLLK